jgi:mannose-1-phosphate guanylyltransferase
MKLTESKVLSSNIWAIILAGGEGERMRTTTTSWLGYHVPKQYCTFVGTRSMLQHTADRALMLASSGHIITIIGTKHRHLLSINTPHKLPGLILEQPCAKDTTPGVFYPLSYVMANDPDATVILLPSDHFVYPESNFIESVRRAVILVEHFEKKLVLLGALPDRCEEDYGWICPKSLKHHDNSFAEEVEDFVEKPSFPRACSCFRSGCYWNTMVSVAKARTFWEIGNLNAPDMMAKFEMLRHVLKAVWRGVANWKIERLAVQYVYENISPGNLSRDLLPKALDRLLVLPLRNVQWSDWGRPSRITESLASIGKLPAFLSSQLSRTGQQMMNPPSLVNKEC